MNRRRALILPATAGMGAALGLPAMGSDSTKTAAHQAPGNCSTPKSAIAKTQYGKVRGYIDAGVLTFKGIPYGQDTAGENRWLPAKPPKVWEGEYPALIYGANCPQSLHDYTAIEHSFLQDWDDGYMSEDMLKLNVWTSSLSGKRPVMVYYHGGGFTFGSSYELPSQEGAQMARYHDVVVVTVNHRLNILGFFDVSEIGGPAYSDSVNVGMTDLVASLKMGAREHFEFRRRSGQGHDLWSVRWRLEGNVSDGHAVGYRFVPSRVSAVWRRRQFPRRRPVQRTGPADHEGTGIAAQRPRLATKDGLGQA